MTTKKKKLYSNLFLQGLELTVHLGWPRAERLQQQTVLLDITVEPAKPPRACITDDMADTHCYDTLISLIKKSIEPQKFTLLEHLGCEVYKVIKTSLPKNTKVNIRVSKAIPNFIGGAIFYYGDGY